MNTSLRISFAVEKHPLGTGGAVKLALQQAEEKEVFVLNGDTFLRTNYEEMLDQHTENGVQATIALKKMQKFERYGVVEIDCQSNRICRFGEKQYCESGFINGGTYLINKQALKTFPDVFSIEKDFFEKYISRYHINGYITDGYFIDIGIPEDYEQAQVDFKNEAYKNI